MTDTVFMDGAASFRETPDRIGQSKRSVIHADVRSSRGRICSSPCCRRSRPALAEEAGYSLIELLVAVSMALLIFGATLDLIFVAFRDQTASGSRAAATQLSSAIVERMTREIRQASQATIEDATSHVSGSGAGNILALQTPVGTSGGATTTQQVLYDCVSTPNQCTRTQGSAGSPVLIIHQVTNSTPVFSGSTVNPAVSPSPVAQSVNPSDITVTLDVGLATQGINNPVELRDGVALRDLAP